MAEYIDKKAAIADLNETYDKMAGFHAQFYNGYQVAVNRLRVFPAAEVEPVRHTTFKDGECMACGWFGDCVDTPHYNYCPGCGARADGGADNG